MSGRYLHTIREALATRSSENIVPPAHTLKSSARQMGALCISELAREIETIAREQVKHGQSNMQPFLEILEQMEAAFEDTKAALAREVLTQGD